VSHARTNAASAKSASFAAVSTSREGNIEVALA
jgi:hypothetical protein